MDNITNYQDDTPKKWIGKELHLVQKNGIQKCMNKTGIKVIQNIGINPTIQSSLIIETKLFYPVIHIHTERDEED